MIHCELPNGDQVTGALQTLPTLQLVVSYGADHRPVRVNSQLDLTANNGFGHPQDAFIFYNKYGTISLVIFDGLEFVEYILN